MIGCPVLESSVTCIDAGSSIRRCIIGHAAAFHLPVNVVSSTRLNIDPSIIITLLLSPLFNPKSTLSTLVLDHQSHNNPSQQASSIMDLISRKPKNAAAWQLEAKKRPVVVSSAPYTSPPEGYVTIRVIDVAINPIDWKVQESAVFELDYPAIVGEFDDDAGV